MKKNWIDIFPLISFIFHLIILGETYYFRYTGSINGLTFTIIFGIVTPMVINILSGLVKKNNNLTFNFATSEFNYHLIGIGALLVILIHGIGIIKLISLEAESPNDLLHFTRTIFFLETIVAIALNISNLNYPDENLT